MLFFMNKHTRILARRGAVLAPWLILAAFSPVTPAQQPPVPEAAALPAQLAAMPPAALERRGESAIRALLVPQTQSILSSQMTGRITKIGVSHGERFKKGTLLVRFDCAVTYAEAQKARAELAAAQKTYESNLQLEKHKAVSNLEIDISKARLDKAKADVARTRALINMCEIHAPFAGRVVKINANPYETVTQGQPLMEVLDDSRLKMQVYVPSAWLQWLKAGDKFKVRIDETGRTYPAEVTALGARVDPVSQTLEIEAQVDGKYPELLAGMSGVAEFSIPQ